MKTLMIVLTLLSVSAMADTGDKAAALGYGKPEDIKFMACDAYANYKEVEGPCRSILNRMNSGHLVNEAQFNSWCGMAKGYNQKTAVYEADYKKVYGKKLDLKMCGK